MAGRGAGRWARGVAALLLLAACAPPPEPGAPDIAHLQRPLSGQYVQIVSVAPRLVELDAAGRAVRAEAAGYCIPRDSVQSSRHAVFMLLSRCEGGGEGLGGALSLLVTDGPMAMGPGELERFFRSPAGLSELGHGGGPGEVDLLGVETGPRATYALVEDRSGKGPKFAGPLVARAFTEINGRMAIATLTSFRGGAADPARLRATLGDVVARLHEANARAIRAEIAAGPAPAAARTRPQR